MLHAKYQNSRPSSFRDEEFEVCLLWSYVPTCAYPHLGRASFDPRGITWTNLVEVYKEMLHTKYQSSRPSSLREEEFWILPSLFLCSNLWPPWWGQSSPQEIIWTNLVEVHKEILHTKYQTLRLPVPEKKNLKMGLIPVLDKKNSESGRLWSKYESYSPCGLGQEDFLSFSLQLPWQPEFFKSNSSNSNFLSISKVHHLRIISVKFHWNLLAGFCGEEFLSKWSHCMLCSGELKKKNKLIQHFFVSDNVFKTFAGFHLWLFLKGVIVSPISVIWGSFFTWGGGVTTSGRGGGSDYVAFW